MSGVRLEGGNALRRCLLRLLLCEQAAYRVVRAHPKGGEAVLQLCEA